MVDEEQTFYVHFPEVSISAPFSALGGTLREVGFQEYAPLDTAWASECHYGSRQRVFWVINVVGPSREAELRAALEDGDLGRVQNWYEEQEDTPDEVLNSVIERAELLHLALVCASAEMMVSPGQSMLYRRPSSGGVSRRMGVAHRTWVLARDKHIFLSPRTLETAAGLVARWVAADLRANHVLLRPVRAVSSVAGGFLSAGAIVALLVIALEASIEAGDIVGGRPRSIAALIRANMSSASGVDIGSRMDPLYAQRSDYLHGRRESSPLETDIILLVKVLTALVAKKTQALPQNDGEVLGD